MSKKNKFVLYSVLLILIAVILICALYNCSNKYMIEYYSAADGDLFLSSMELESLTVFSEGQTLISGSFLQSNDPFSQYSLYIKTYDAEGAPLCTGSIELPADYIYYDKVVLTDRVNLIYVPAAAAENTCAVVYEVSSEGILLSEKTLSPENYVFGSTDYYITADENGIFSAVRAENELFIYDENNALLSVLKISPEVSINKFMIIDGVYFILGSIENGSTYCAYYGAYDQNGDQLYAVSTMKENTAVCTNITKANTSNGGYFICGYYFDTDAFLSSYYQTAEQLNEEQLNAMADKSIRRACPGKSSVLISSDFYTEPWASFFIIEIDSKGDVVNSLSPISVSSVSGISNVSYVASYNEDDASSIDSDSKYPFVSVTSAVAEKEKSGSYSVNVYNIYSDLSMSLSAEIKLNSNTSALFAASPSGELIVYTGINGLGEYHLYIYENIAEYASEQKLLVLFRYIVDFIDSSLNVLPISFVYLLLIITMRYSYLRYIERKEQIRKLTAGL